MFSHKPTVLITGGAGYVGSHAVLNALDRHWAVLVLDNLSTGIRGAVPDAARFYCGDIGDAELLGKIFSSTPVDAVLHFAGSVVVPESVYDPMSYYHNNVSKTATLIRAAINHNIRCFVFSSTAAVYGTPDTHMVSENDRVRPESPYGHSKLMVEQMLRDASAAHDINHIILRYFNVAGADPLGRAGQSTPGATHLIKAAVETALGLRDRLSVFGTDYNTTDGTGVRDYIHVTDLINAHMLSLEQMLRGSLRNRTFNCGYGHGYSVLEVIQTLESVLNREIPRTLAGRRPGDIGAIVADSSQIKEAIGWQPKYDDLRSIIIHALNWESFQTRRPHR